MNTLATTDAIELMYETGWTDGLPTVPPTREKVEQFIGYTGRSPDDLIAELPPMGGQATIERIAVNAVMAGCLPEHMPVVIAAIEALVDDRFNLRGVSVVRHSGSEISLEVAFPGHCGHTKVLASLFAVKLTRVRSPAEDRLKAVRENRRRGRTEHSPRRWIERCHFPP